MSDSAHLFRDVYKRTLIRFLDEAGWPYFETLESQREGWPGDTKNGLPSHCLFGGETSEFNFFTSNDFVKPLLDENEAGGSSGSGT